MVKETFVEMFAQHYQNVVKCFYNIFKFKIKFFQLNISIMLSKYFSSKCLENILEML